MGEVSTVRLYLLRAGYVLIAVGLTLMIWPGIVSHSDSLPHMNGVVRSLLGAVCLLSYLGIRYPLKMLPVLLFELVWKTIWLLAFGLPLWFHSKLDADTGETFYNCVFGIFVVLIVVPWGYVLRHYVIEHGEPWRSRID